MSRADAAPGFTQKGLGFRAGAPGSGKVRMIRKSAFIGLTMALVAVLVWLAWQGRKEEAAQLEQAPKEVVQTVVPSPTRAIDPPDLVISEARMELLAPGEATGPEMPAARHQLQIRNSGTVTYGDLLLQFSYLAGNGKLLEAVTKKVSAQVPPGATVTLDEVTVEGVPEGAQRCTVRILYAEIPGPPAPEATIQR